MADIVINMLEQLPNNMQKRYKDMGDGTWAEVVSAVTGAGENNIGDVDISTFNGAANLATNQVSVTNAATAIVAARAGRRAVMIINHGTTAVYIGGASVTTANGLFLTGTAGAAVSIPTTAAVYGIVSTGTQTVSYIEVYD